MQRIVFTPLAAFSALLLACGAPDSNQVLEPATTEFAVTGQCDALIASLRTSTATLESISQKDPAGLLGKLDNAARALSVGKNADAAQKLTDFLNKVTTLKAQGKLAADDADRLIAGAGNAIACINDATTT
jgi:hypothetical protein